MNNMLSKYLNTLFNLIFLAFFLLIINSCAHYKIKELENSDFKSENVFTLVSKAYKDFAKFELYDMHDELDANYFAYKALLALKEKKVFPENPEQWNIPKDKLDELKENYNLINALLDRKDHMIKPKQFAKMLTGYDCWVEQLEENWQFDDIENCRSKFYTNYDKIVVARQETTNVVSQKDSSIQSKSSSTSKNNNEKEVNKVFHVRVFFSFDSHILDELETSKLDNIIENASSNKDLGLYIEGHTDTKGSEKYNLTLSNKRANFIKNLLEKNNVSNRITIEAFGEKKPLFLTKDNVKEKKNRRAEITLK